MLCYMDYALQTVDTKSIIIIAEDRDILVVCPVFSNHTVWLMYEKVQA